MEETATQAAKLARAVALGNLVLEPDTLGRFDSCAAPEHELLAIEPLEGARSTNEPRQGASGGLPQSPIYR